MNSILIDTSCWVGFFLRRDQHHAASTSLLDRLEDQGRPLMTSDYILSETVTRLRKQGGASIAAAAWAELESGRTVELLEVGRSDRAEALRLFRKFDDHVLSVTDCTSMALMVRFGIREIATFDEDFRRAGCRVLP